MGTVPYLLWKHFESDCILTLENERNSKTITKWQRSSHIFYYGCVFSIWLGFISSFIVSKHSSSTDESVPSWYDSWKKKRRKRERKLLEKYLIHWAFSAFVPQSDTVVILKNPCAAVRDGETLPTFQFPSSSPSPALSHHHPVSSFTHTQASCLPLILQIVSKTCLRSISAEASPVIDQLQQNQLQAF